jgi:hypothetical protein
MYTHKEQHFISFIVCDGKTAGGVQLTMVWVGRVPVVEKCSASRICGCTLWHSWLRHYATSQKGAYSVPK